MPGHYTAVMKRTVEGWRGWIIEVPGVTGQAYTKEALRDALRYRLLEVLLYYRDVIIATAGDGWEEEEFML